jgi:hypothetical protein
MGTEPAVSEVPSTAAGASPALLPRRRFGCLHVVLFVGVAVVVTAVVSFFVVRALLFPPPLTPVKLNARDEKALQSKLDRLDFTTPAVPVKAQVGRRPGAPAAGAALEPEPYSEAGAERTIRFTEKEINALLAKNTDLADKLAIDLAQDLVSAKLLVPLDADLPVLGGKTLRVKAGLTCSYADGRPVLMFRGVTVMGVPLPNAWLGGLKNVDLITSSSPDNGFWKAFAEGVESVRVEEGSITIRLRE